MPPITETLTPVGREQRGLKWERDTFDLMPVWTEDPDIQCIKEICYELLGQPRLDVEIKVEFLDEGAFNRVYSVDRFSKVQASSDAQLKTGIVETTHHFKYIFRVSLPVDPRLKISSEVATIQYVNEYTTILVTAVLHNSSQSANNALGFEWMLQAYVPGRKLSTIWHQLGDAGRERMIQQLAAIQTELFQKARFRQIGSIFRRDEQESGDSTQDDSTRSSPHHFYVGKIVSNTFLLRSALIEIANRGPFRTTADWLFAQLETVILACERLQESSNENDLEAAERSGHIARRLFALVPKLFPDSGSEEETFLFHDDLSQENIFCREDGTITAILDWEATSCLPLWAAYDFPQLLQGADYLEEPDSTKCPRGADNPLFQDQLLMWQQMKLKRTYVETMNRIWPEWSGEYGKEQNRIQRDFRNAVDLCDSELCWNTITKWLDENDQLQATNEYVPLALH